MNKLNVQPLGANVIIEPVPIEEKTASGLIIPKSAKIKQPEGTVIAVPDNNKVEVKVGDKVLYRGAGTDITINGKSYLIISQVDILAVV